MKIEEQIIKNRITYLSSPLKSCWLFAELQLDDSQKHMWPLVVMVVGEKFESVQFQAGSRRRVEKNIINISLKNYKMKNLKMVQWFGSLFSVFCAWKSHLQSLNFKEFQTFHRSIMKLIHLTIFSLPMPSLASMQIWSTINKLISSSFVHVLRMYCSATEKEREKGKWSPIKLIEWIHACACKLKPPNAF